MVSILRTLCGRGEKLGTTVSVRETRRLLSYTRTRTEQLAHLACHRIILSRAGAGYWSGAFRGRLQGPTVSVSVTEGLVPEFHFLEFRSSILV
jgi:hypothetical protein